MAANVSTKSSGRLLVMDRNSKQRDPVHTGSDQCVIRSRLMPGRWKHIDYTLYDANRTTIPTYGWTSRSMNLKLRREFTWRFLIVDVGLPMIGVDLLPYYGLLLDCRNNVLHDSVTSLSKPGFFAIPSVPSVKVIAGGKAPDSNLEEFPVLTNPARKNREALRTQRITPAQHTAHL